MSTVLELKNVTKKFGGLTAVNDLSLKVEEHEIHALIGPNGAGKTTATNMIEGVYHPTSGNIFYKGEDITNLKTHEIANKGIGRTFQNIKLYDTMTALENVMVGGHQLTKLDLLPSIFRPKALMNEDKMLKEKAEKMLKYVNLYDIKDEYVKNLPYGKKKVLEVARALMMDPELLLLDEPAAGLNPSERAEFVALIMKIYNDGKTIFMIEHNMDVVMNVSHMITVVNFGAKIAEGTPEEIQTNPEVIKAYLGERYKVK